MKKHDEIIKYLKRISEESFMNQIELNNAIEKENKGKKCPEKKQLIKKLKKDKAILKKKKYNDIFTINYEDLMRYMCGCYQKKNPNLVVVYKDEGEGPFDSFLTIKGLTKGKTKDISNRSKCEKIFFEKPICNFLESDNEKNVIDANFLQSAFTVENDTKKRDFQKTNQDMIWKFLDYKSQIRQLENQYDKTMNKYCKSKTLAAMEKFKDNSIKIQNEIENIKLKLQPNHCIAKN